MIKRIKALKLRLQFTGWLQYILTAVVSTIVLIIGLLIGAVFGKTIAMPFLLVSLILYIIVSLDIITVKFKLHPQEKLPERKDKLEQFNLMRTRRSCRSFQITKLKSEDYFELMEHVNIETEVINKNETIKTSIRFEYINDLLTVWPVVNAQEFLVAIAPKEYNRKAIINIGRSLQKIVIHATRMGLATCWIGPGAEQTSIINKLGDSFNEETEHIICVCAIGYASMYKPFSIRVMSFIQHRRMSLSELFFADRLKQLPLDYENPSFKRFERCYEVCQWSPSSFNAQTTRCVGTIIDLNKVRMDFYCATESRFYAPIALGIWCGNWELGCDALGIKGEFVFLTDVNHSGTKQGKPIKNNINKEMEDNSVIKYDICWIEQ